MSSTKTKSGRTRRPMFVVSFYSYKGGVGRSVALMNTAHQLASSGRRVVMLDFDLEAPGLNSACNAVWPKSVLDSQPGFLDFFSRYLRNPKVVPRISNYMSRGFGPGNLVRLVPAGNLTDFNGYSEKLLELNGKLLDEKVFAREMLLKLRDDFAEMGFDYLLVDSRTGHTDILGATTVLLPHLVVLVTNLSAQSLKGTRSVLDWIEAASDAAIAQRRPEIITGENRFFLRSIHDPAIQRMVIASPVPLGDHTAIAEAECETGDLRCAFDHVIYYVPGIAANESQHVAKTSDEDPVYQYRDLADKIRELNPFEPSTLVEYGMQSLERQDWTRALSYFNAAEHFLPNESPGLSDRQLNLRRQYGEVRALALGFQTRKARELLDKIEAAAIPQGLAEESFAANMQLVRGHLASNELDKALRPALDAVKCAKMLGERQRKGNRWEVLARLQLGDVYFFLGEMEEAENAVKDVPKQAIVLNRAMERVKAYQLLATTQGLTGRFHEAERSLTEATTQANRLGVDYLIAGCAFIRSVIDLTNGRLEQDSVSGLELAMKSYEDEGDGLSTADCMTELAIYVHRMGIQDISVTDKYLTDAWRLYREIAGARLGQVNVLLYSAEIRIDRGELDCVSGDRWRDASDRMSSASESLKRALRIVSDYGLPEDLKKDVQVWASLVNLFLDKDRQIEVDEIESEYPTPNEVSIPDPRLVLRQRNLAFRSFLRNPTSKNLKVLSRIADQAKDFQFGYNEAITRTLVALGAVRIDDTDCFNSQIERIEQLVKNGKLGWSIWGQVNSVRAHLLIDSPEKLKDAAATLLEVATKRELLEQPACWLKEPENAK